MNWMAAFAFGLSIFNLGFAVVGTIAGRVSTEDYIAAAVFFAAALVFLFLARRSGEVK